MADNALQELLKNTFPESDSKAWERVATSELDGAHPFEKLRWQSADQLDFFPYYDGESISSLDYLKKFQLPPVIDAYTGYRAWWNMPNVPVNNELQANGVALTHLVNGADAILFELKKNSTVDFNKLLDKIEWPYCAISFSTASAPEFLPLLNDYFKKVANPSQLQGCLFWKTTPASGQVRDLPTGAFRQLGITISTSTPAQEIAQALAKGVQTIEALKTFSPSVVAKHIAFSVPMGGDFLQQIAKLKALRMLWYQVVCAYGVNDYQPHDLHIHSRSEAWVKESYQPHGNMIHSAAVSLASIAGGCNALTVYPEDADHGMMARVARNISNILREESHLDKVADPVAGAYVIENMVHALAQKSWKLFQSTVAS